MRRLLLVCVFLVGCNEQGWVKAEPDPFASAKITCEAKGYEIAGPEPRIQLVSRGKDSAVRAFDMGKSIGSWKKAFNAGFTSCMNKRGYVATD